MPKTFFYEQSIKSLNVASLEDTLELYLDCLKPLVSLNEYNHTQEIVSQYYQQAGPYLHEKLVAYSERIKPKSWMLPYSQDIYLRIKEPIILEGNYCVETIPLTNLKQYNYLEFTSILVHAIGSVFLEVYNETIEPMMSKDGALSNYQLRSFLIEQRKVLKFKDETIVYHFPKQSNSFGVFIKNNFFIVKLFESDGTLLSTQTLYNALTTIYDYDIEELAVNYNTTSFTTSDKTFEIIDCFTKDLNNYEAMLAANKTMFNITLNQSTSDNVNQVYKYFSNTDDIWPYKGWSITVYQDNVLLFNNEHTFIDGLTSVYLINNVIEEMMDNHIKFKAAEYDRDYINEIAFFFKPKTKEKLNIIKNDYLRRVNSMNILSLIYENIPFSKLKAHQINIDIIFQLAFLYAQRYSFHNLKTMHESVSANHYYEGRTSTIQSISEEGLMFVDALASNSSNSLELLKQASDKHCFRIKKAKEFCSILRYHSALAVMIACDKIVLEDDSYKNLIEDESFTKYRTAEISTSTFGKMEYVKHFVFAPAVIDGLGIGYLINDCKAYIDITYYQNIEDEMLKFEKNLNEYFTKLSTLFE